MLHDRQVPWVSLRLSELQSQLISTHMSTRAQQVAPAPAPPPRAVVRVLAAQWLLHRPHSMTAAETRHQAGRQQGPVEA